MGMARELASCRIRMSSIAFWDMRFSGTIRTRVSRRSAKCNIEAIPSSSRQSLMNSGGNDNEDVWSRSLEGCAVRQPDPAALWAKCLRFGSPAQLEALDLARRGLGQLRHELEPARALVRRDLVLHEGLELRLERGLARLPVLEHHQRLRLDPLLGVGLPRPP